MGRSGADCSAPWSADCAFCGEVGAEVAAVEADSGVVVAVEVPGWSSTALGEPCPLELLEASVRLAVHTGASACLQAQGRAWQLDK